MHFLANLLPFALSAAATGIMLPLYVYPNATAPATGTSTSNWNPIFSAIEKYPNVRWQIIINPDTGPGTGTTSDSVFNSNVQRLNSYSNVLTIGYVESYHATRPYNDAVADIKTYAGWSSVKGWNISMHGIFFDDVSSWYDFNDYPKTYSVNYTWYSNITSYAYSTFPGSNTQVVLNTGGPANKTFFDISDTIVEFEDLYSKYSNTTSVNDITSRGNGLNWGSFLFTDTPNITAKTINNLVNYWDNAGVEFVYFTSDHLYAAINATLLNAVAYACANY